MLKKPSLHGATVKGDNRYNPLTWWMWSEVVYLKMGPMKLLKSKNGIKRLPWVTCRDIRPTMLIFFKSIKITVKSCGFVCRNGRLIRYMALIIWNWKASTETTLMKLGWERRWSNGKKNFDKSLKSKINEQFIDIDMDMDKTSSQSSTDKLSKDMKSSQKNCQVFTTTWKTAPNH